MLRLESGVIYYDNVKKKTGYVYDPNTCLYRRVLKYDVEKLKREGVYREVECNIEPVLDNYNGYYPISSNLVIDFRELSTKTRCEHDYFTYVLPQPVYTDLTPKISEWVDYPDTLKNFIRSSLLNQLDNHTLIVQGNIQSIFELFKFFNPVFKLCSDKLFYRLDVGTTVLKDLEKCRLVYTDMGDKTIRRCKNFNKPLVTNDTQISASHIDTVFKIKILNPEIKINANEWLGWILK